jgi:hypothetical protein
VAKLMELLSESERNYFERAAIQINERTQDFVKFLTFYDKVGYL